MSVEDKSVEDKVRQILVDILDVPADSLTPDANLMVQLGANSTDIVEIVTAIENEYDVMVTDDDINAVRTVGAIIDFVKRKGKG